MLDTAGLRPTGDAVEQIGIERAQRALDAASVALVVVDGSRPLDADALAVLQRTRDRPRVVLFNKRDLGLAGFAARDAAEAGAISGWLDVAGHCEEPNPTLDRVRAAIAEVGWGGETVDLARPHLASARQADAVARAREALAFAERTLVAGDALDLVAPDLVATVAALRELTGAAATEAVLDGVFARFCIGK